MQSAGGAVAWQIDTHKVPLVTQLVVNWSLTTISYPLLVVLVILAVKDDNITTLNIESKTEKPSVSSPAGIGVIENGSELALPA